MRAALLPIAAALAALLATGCGDHRATAAVESAEPLQQLASGRIIAPLLDDEGRLMPADAVLPTRDDMADQDLRVKRAAALAAPVPTF